MPYGQKKNSKPFNSPGRRNPNGPSRRSRLPGEKASLRDETGSQERNEKSGKRIRVEKEDSSFHLGAPNDDVTKSPVSVTLEQGTPIISVEIEGTPRSLILDTGSSVSILQPRISRCDARITTMKPYGVTGKS